MVQMMVDMDEALARIGQKESEWARWEKEIKDIPVKQKISEARQSLLAVRNKIQPPRHEPENPNLRKKLNWLLRQVRILTVSQQRLNQNPLKFSAAS